MQTLFDRGEEGSLRGMEQAVSPYFLEAAGKHVLEEATDELLGGHRDGFHAAGLGITVAKRDMTVLERDDVSVADGDREDIRGQVLNGCLAAADGDDVHHPILFPEVRRDLIEKAGSFQQIAEFAAEDLGQGLFR